MMWIKSIIPGFRPAFISTMLVPFFISCSSIDSKQESERTRLLSESELVSKKEYTSLEQAFKVPDSVFKLNISNQGIKTIPKEIQKLKNLQYLNVGNNKLNEIPDEICDLTNLEDFLAYSNNIKSLPEKLGNMQNLKSLAIYDNKLTYLPDGIGQLAKLEFLNLENNELESLPEIFGNLSNLKHLMLSHNKLSKFGFDLGKLSKLENLCVFENNFSEAYLADLSEKYPKMEIQNDDCVFNTNYKKLSSDYILEGGIKNYIWRATDSSAIGFLDNGDSIVTKIGGCFFAEHNVQFIIHDSVTLADSLHWLSKALSLFRQFKDSATAANIEYKKIRLDQTNSRPDYRTYFIIDESGKKESLDAEGNNDTGIVFKRKGNNSVSISYSWYMD